ncbi:MAG TPA: HlyD family secretion protein [Tepidisphaeraceae bacterium]|jgi:membrane fusion protein (multidrug efflux system)|nr:HlyD family secretion protein [Tepidisphaeraceae bacterium]
MATDQADKPIQVENGLTIPANAAVATPISNQTAIAPSAAPAASHGVPMRPAKASRYRKWALAGVAAVALVAAVFLGGPTLWEALNTISTDDAYVNGHATFVAPRVSGQIVNVFVDDNNRVRKGDLLVQLDKQPYQVQVAILKSAVATAQADFQAARAMVRGTEALARSQRWKLQRSIESVDDQIASLRTNVAALDSARAVLSRAQADYDRVLPLTKTGAVSAEELDRRKQVLAVAEAQVKQALETVYQTRVALGLPAQPEKGEDLAQTPADLDQTFSSVRQAQAELMQTAAQIGVTNTFNMTPREMLTEFYKRDPQGNIDRIYASLLLEAPAVKQAEAKIAQAQAELDQAELNLSYCDVFAEIDGVVTRRNVNPGNNVVAGQELMVIRSLREIWVDANFKETELARLRIGQPVDLHLDMYGKRKIFKGRITGFTMGTGSTLALLPAQNATGNFVKVVQRLPVRIDIENYDPETDPLFIGLSVEPRVFYKEPATGPDAGKVLQPNLKPTSIPAPSPGAAALIPATQPSAGENQR